MQKHTRVGFKNCRDDLLLHKRSSGEWNNTDKKKAEVVYGVQIFRKYNVHDIHYFLRLRNLSLCCNCLTATLQRCWMHSEAIPPLHRTSPPPATTRTAFASSIGFYIKPVRPPPGMLLRNRSPPTSSRSRMSLLPTPKRSARASTTVSDRTKDAFHPTVSPARARRSISFFSL